MAAISPSPSPPLRLVLDVSVGTVAALGGFGVPLAVGGLVFDRLGTSRHALFGGGPLGGGQRHGTRRKGFRKYAIHGVGPAAVMLDDLVGDVAHVELAFLLAGRGECTAHSMTKCRRYVGFAAGYSSSVR